MMGTIQRLLREPLLHFFAAGGLIFLFFATVREREESRPDVIVVSAEQVDRLAVQFEAVWSRKPTAAELDHVIDGYIREEVYYREALALGLDKNDAVVRQRMRQKIEFLTDIGAQLIDATDKELELYLAENKEKYSLGAQRALEQIFLGQTVTKAVVEQALRSLRSNSGDAVGVRSMLPAELSLATADGIDSIYGAGFWAQIVDYPVGVWSGPVTSAYGIHVVRVLARQAHQPFGLADIRATVLRDWQADKAQELRELDYLARKERFTIEIYDRTENPGESP